MTPLDVATNREIIRLLKKAQNEEVDSMVKVSSEQNFFFNHYESHFWGYF